MEEPSKKEPPTEVDEIGQYCLEQSPRHIVDPEQVRRYNACSELAKKLAERMKWDLKTAEADMEGQLLFTMPISIMENEEERHLFAALVQEADAFFVFRGSNNNVEISFTFRLYNT